MDRKIPRNVPSNEEVVDELTKGLKKSCLKERTASEEGERFFHVYNETEKVSGKDDESNSEQQDEASETKSYQDEASEVKSDKDDEDEYYIDECQLKDRDVDLSEEEKQVFKAESENLKNKGNNLFREGEYVNATSTYTEGLRICPLVFEKERAILYANRAAAKAKFMEKKLSAIDDCTKAVELDSNYVKAYLRRAHFYEVTDKLDDALADYKKVLTFDPTNTESIYAVRKLEPMIQERNEKLKEEMMGKLKDIGNLILRPFGLSTNNFELQKDDAGGYSVKFNQNSS